MEERIIDDEYGRGIRLKKTKDGYVDATDELAENQGENGEEAELTEEVAEDEEEFEEEVYFAFPEEGGEDDEELAALSAEDARELLKKREEEKRAREEKTRLLSEEGEARLAIALNGGEESEAAYEKAAEAFDEALVNTPCDMRAGVGFWRAKTRGGKNLQPLLDEWAGYEYEEFKETFGEECTAVLQTEWKEKAAEEMAAREEKVVPMRQAFEAKTEKRREILKERTLSTRKKFIPALSAQLALLVFTVIFAANIFSRPDAVFVWLTAISGVLFVLVLPFFCLASSKFANASKLFRKNETRSSTEEGRALQKTEDEIAFLADFLKAGNE